MFEDLDKKEFDQFVERVKIKYPNGCLCKECHECPFNNTSNVYSIVICNIMISLL